MRNASRTFSNHTRSPRSVQLFAATIAMGLLTACGSGGGMSEEKQPAAQMGTSEQKDEASVGGTGAVRLPENFPAEFPLPPDLKVTQGTFTEGSATTQANYLVRGTSAMSVEEIANFYQKRLPEAGYDVQNAQPVTAGATSALVYFHGDKFKDASIQLSSARGSTDVLISLPLRD